MVQRLTVLAGEEQGRDDDASSSPSAGAPRRRPRRCPSAGTCPTRTGLQHPLAGVPPCEEAPPARQLSLISNVAPWPATLCRSGDLWGRGRVLLLEHHISRGEGVVHEQVATINNN